jgi:hypothetical protein
LSTVELRSPAARPRGAFLDFPKQSVAIPALTSSPIVVFLTFPIARLASSFLPFLPLDLSPSPSPPWHQQPAALEQTHPTSRDLGSKSLRRRRCRLHHAQRARPFFVFRRTDMLRRTSVAVSSTKSSRSPSRPPPPVYLLEKNVCFFSSFDDGDGALSGPLRLLYWQSLYVQCVSSNLAREEREGFSCALGGRAERK